MEKTIYTADAKNGERLIKEAKERSIEAFKEKSKRLLKLQEKGLTSKTLEELDDPGFRLYLHKEGRFDSKYHSALEVSGGLISSWYMPTRYLSVFEVLDILAFFSKEPLKRHGYERLEVPFVSRRNQGFTLKEKEPPRNTGIPVKTLLTDCRGRILEETFESFVRLDSKELIREVISEFFEEKRGELSEACEEVKATSRRRI